MKKFTFLLFAILACSFSSFAQVVVLSSTFEDGTTDSWTNYSSATQGVTTSDVYDGSYSMYITNATAGDFWSLQPYHAVSALTNGNRYEISFWAKSDADATTQFALQTPSGSYGANYSSVFSTTSTWTQYKDTITVSSADRTRALFQVGATATTYYFDDIVLTNIDETLDYILNGTFESGLSHWSRINGASGCMTTATPGYAGDSAMQIVNATAANYWSTQIQTTFGLSLTADTEYKLTYYVKSNTAGSILRASTTGSAHYEGDVTTTTDWQEVTWTFTADGSETGVGFDCGLNAATFYIDSVKLEEVSTSGITSASESALTVTKDGSLVKFNQTVDNASLFDLNGRQILSANNCSEIELSGCSKGVYILKANIDKKNLVAKVIK